MTYLFLLLEVAEGNVKVILGAGEVTGVWVPSMKHEHEGGMDVEWREPGSCKCQVKWEEKVAFLSLSFASLFTPTHLEWCHGFSMWEQVWLGGGRGVPPTIICITHMQMNNICSYWEVFHKTSERVK